MNRQLKLNPNNKTFDMKKISLIILIILVSRQLSFAQWTTSGTNIYTNLGGNVGIGTTSPQTKLHIVGGEIRLAGMGSTGVTSQSFLSFYDSNNSTRYGWIGDGSSTNNDIYLYADAGNSLHFATNGVNDRMFINTSGYVGINTTDTKGYQFAVNGSAIATSMTVKLNANWPDYVFKSNYQLPSLTDVKTYIDQTHHLPEMPSEYEVAKDGINLGEMNKLLTKKVEELTLYLIDKDKQLNNQQEKMAQMEARLERLEKTLTELSKTKQ